MAESDIWAAPFESQPLDALLTGKMPVLKYSLWSDSIDRPHRMSGHFGMVASTDTIARPLILLNVGWWCKQLLHGVVGLPSRRERL